MLARTLLVATTASLASGALIGSPLALARSASRLAASRASAPSMGAYDFSVRDLDENKVVDLADYKGKVSLIVNVASRWGLTDANYRELQSLYERLAPEGFAVLAFPCNQFGAQEPGTPQDIREFVSKYGVTFPMFAKIDVNGVNTHPLYKYLKQEKGELMGNDIKWNFAKFLVDADGTPVKRYAPPTSPNAIEADIRALLAKIKVAA